MRFFTADLHFGHRKVAALRGYLDVDMHDAHIRQHWFDRVTDNDIVYVLGDISMNMNHGLDMMRDLPGRKRLIAGNHDMCHPRFTNAPAREVRYREVFEWVAPFGKVKIDGVEFLLSHYPYNGDSGPIDRDPQWRLPNFGRPLLHGHTHSNNAVTSGIEFHVGWDAWGKLVPENLIPVDAWRI